MHKRINKRDWIWCAGCGNVIPLGAEYCDYSAGSFCHKECHRKWRKLEHAKKEKDNKM